MWSRAADLVWADWGRNALTAEHARFCVHRPLSFSRMSFLLRRARITPVPALSHRCLHAIADNDPFHRLNLRVGKITDVDDHPDGEHLYVETGPLQ